MRRATTLYREKTLLTSAGAMLTPRVCRCVRKRLQFSRTGLNFRRCPMRPWLTPFRLTTFIAPPASLSFTHPPPLYRFLWAAVLVRMTRWQQVRTTVTILLVIVPEPVLGAPTMLMPPPWVHITLTPLQLVLVWMISPREGRVLTTLGAIPLSWMTRVMVLGRVVIRPLRGALVLRTILQLVAPSAPVVMLESPAGTRIPPTPAWRKRPPPNGTDKKFVV